MKQEEIIKYLLIAAGVYLVYQFLTGDKDKDETQPSSGSDKGTGTGTGTNPPALPPGGRGANPPANTTTPAPSPTPSPTPAPVEFVTRRELEIVTQGIVPRLKAAANNQNSFTVDEWNWFLRKLNPNAVATDLSEVRPASDRNAKMTAEQYMAFRVQAGLEAGGNTDQLFGPGRGGADRTERGGGGGSMRGYGAPKGYFVN